MSPPTAFPAFLSRLLQLWTDKCRGRAMPARRDFPAVDLEPWLTELHLVAVRPEGLRFTVFAAGPAGRYGREMTGRYVSELEPPALADEVERAYLAAVDRLLVAVWDESVGLSRKSAAGHALLMSRWTLDTEIPQSTVFPPRAAEMALTAVAE